MHETLTVGRFGKFVGGLVLRTKSTIIIVNAGVSSSDKNGSSRMSGRETTTVNQANDCAFVMSDPHIFDVGIGNQLFMLSTAVYVAELTGRRPALPKLNRTLGLDEVFDLDVDRYDPDATAARCRPYSFQAVRPWYDPRVDAIFRRNSSTIPPRQQSVVISGYFHSWKYTRPVEGRLRQRHLRFRSALQRQANAFLAGIVPPTWSVGFVRVGVHVRRGDVVLPGNIRFGFCTPNASYYHTAMRYFTARYDRVQFVVVTNDWTWTRQNVVYQPMPGEDWSWRVNVTYAVGKTRGDDFTVLASCDHVIMSTGTFGWWGAWMADGMTVFYKHWPRAGSAFYRGFKYDDFFLPSWIGME